MATLGIILSSVRPNRVGASVADWVLEGTGDWDVDLIDLKQLALPSFDEPNAPKSGADRETTHAVAWAERFSRLDAVVILTPQYNGSYPGALKNAIDYLYDEWTGLPVLTIGYGWGDASEVLDLLGRLLSRFGTDVVDEIGLGFGTDLSPEGVLDVRPEKQEALVTALTALGRRVEARTELAVS